MSLQDTTEAGAGHAEIGTSLPPRLRAVLETQPVFVSRRRGAALLREHVISGIGERNLEDRRRWPLPTKFIGRTAMVETAALFVMAWRRIEDAPECPPSPPPKRADFGNRDHSRPFVTAQPGDPPRRPL